jgi:hypothetical protein
MVDVDEDGRLVERADGTGLAARERLGAGGDRRRDVVVDDLLLRRRGERADVLRTCSVVLALPQPPVADPVASRSDAQMTLRWRCKYTAAARDIARSNSWHADHHADVASLYF